MQIANKVIIITGGSNGIGRALSLYFISRKAKAVVIADVSKPNEESKGITYFNCDVTSSDQLRQLFLHTLNLFGQVDILVNNAGIASNIYLDKDEKLEYRKVIDIDLTAVIEGTRLAIKHMKRGGVVVNISSMAGLIPGSMDPVYSAAKSGVVMFTRSTRKYTKEHGIRINTICPLFVDTNILKQVDKLDKSMAKLLSQLPKVPMQTVIDAIMSTIENENMVASVIKVINDGFSLVSFPEIDASRL